MKTQNLILIFMLVFLTSQLNAQWTSPEGPYTYTTDNVGIGTTTPDKDLEIYGSYATLRLSEYTDVMEIWDIEKTQGGLDFKYSHDGGAFSTHLSINSYTGNVGIGLTSPSYKLHVSDRMKLDGTNAGMWVEAGTNDWFVGRSGENLRFYNAGDKITIEPDGNVGIGTTNPTNKLHVSDRMKLDGTNAGMWVEAGTNDWLVGRSGENLRFYNAGDKITIEPDGNVGIGTTNPTNKLHVVGNVSIGYSGSSSAYTNGLIVYGKSYFNQNMGIQEEPQSDCALYIVKIGGQSYSIKAQGSMYLSSGSYQVSDIRFKKNINTIKNALDIINNVRGTTFEYKTKEFEKQKFDEGMHYGFIAQEVKEILPELVKEGDSSFLAINYDGFIPILTEGIKELQKVISSQNKEIENLKKLIEGLNNTDKTITNESVSFSSNNKNYELYQNIPNPFNKQTEIKCYLAEQVSEVSIMIFDLQGKLKKQYSLSGLKGENTVYINANELPPGMYLYTLIIDQKEIDTKRMILSE